MKRHLLCVAGVGFLLGCAWATARAEDGSAAAVTNRPTARGVQVTAVSNRLAAMQGDTAGAKQAAAGHRGSGRRQGTQQGTQQGAGQSAEGNRQGVEEKGVQQGTREGANQAGGTVSGDKEGGTQEGTRQGLKADIRQTGRASSQESPAGSGSQQNLEAALELMEGKEPGGQNPGAAEAAGVLLGKKYEGTEEPPAKDSRSTLQRYAPNQWKSGS